MSAKAGQLESKGRSVPKRKLHYRGVLLQSPAVPPRTPLARIQKAVQAAVAKNADALASGE